MSASLLDEKKSVLERLADKNSLAIVITDENSTVVAEANNNSICRALYSSKEFAARCEAFCGKAFQAATEAEKTVNYKCHAGLSCLAVPLKANERRLVAIVGRTFLKAKDYREATERAMIGDWRQFPPTKFFENVLLTGSVQALEDVAEKLEKADGEENQKLLSSAAASPLAEKKTSLPNEINLSREPGRGVSIRAAAAAAAQSRNGGVTNRSAPFQQMLAADEHQLITLGNREHPEDIVAWRSLFGSLLKLGYKQACSSILNFLTERYELTSLIWLEYREKHLEAVLSTDEINHRQIQISIAADDERLIEAARSETSIEVRRRRPGADRENEQTIYLFPVAIGGEVRSALAVADRLENENKRKQLARFCQTVASELEILRLREKLSQQDWLRQAVNRFNESLKKIDTEDFWLNLMQISAELLRSERASLLTFNEKANVLQAKAAVGAPEDLTRQKIIGDRVAQMVLYRGTPLIIGQIEQLGLPAAPLVRQYRTTSFISYPIVIGERKIAVLNFTDRADRQIFNEFDLELLRAIVPQIAVAIDRAALKDKAGEFEQLSVTDSLTGLMNRRYLQARLSEEIKRSERHGYPMSFMMIDVDDFKSYNDHFGHAEGDRALRMIGQILKDTLRGADVAVRYGGEEFSILLPQTTSEEAAATAERIRQKIETTVFPHRAVTVSIGISNCSSEVNSPRTLVSTADKALYAAKRRGRNNVQIYENLEN